MKTGIALFASVALSLGYTAAIAAQQAAPSVPAQLTVTINAQQTGAPVSKNLFGMFIENGGTLVYRSLWSEMLDDRKFYFPISSHDPAIPTPLRARFLNRRQGLNFWRPVGPDEVVVMDKDHPFVGEHGPRIALDPSTPHGIQQSGLALVKGKKYVGRIYLRATPGTKVNVSLIWGDGANDRQAVSFTAHSDVFSEHALQFTAGADSNEGRLEITGTGGGDFHIGTVSLMPADNIDGFRPDTIALLRQLHSGVWRLPGGNFISGWSWYNSVGDIDKRPPVWDWAWNAMQSNDVGMDEFMDLCKLIGVDPYITVNAGYGDEHSAGQEVQYLNGSVDTPMGAWRARNGHSTPYRVKLWDIGNEPYGPWQLGSTALNLYEIKHNLFAEAMRQADPSITLLASGAMPDEMLVEGINRVMHLRPDQVTLCSDADWTCGFIQHSWGNFDGITEHWYARSGLRFDLEHDSSLPWSAAQEDGYVPADYTLLEWARAPSDRVRMKAEQWQAYEQKFPATAKNKIFMAVDEYSYSGSQPNLKLALAYAMVFNEMMRHTDFLTMSAFTMGVSTLSYNRTASALNTTGLLFKLYGAHFAGGSIPVSLSGDSPQPLPAQHIVGDLPLTSAGSPSYPLDMFAALTPDHKYLNLAVVNATEKEQKFELNIAGARVEGPSTLWLVTGKDLQAENLVGQTPQVEVKEIPIGNAPKMISVAPISIDIYRFPIEQ